MACAVDGVGAGGAGDREGGLVAAEGVGAGGGDAESGGCGDEEGEEESYEAEEGDYVFVAGCGFGVAVLGHFLAP